jgi:hypothetical protein
MLADGRPNGEAFQRAGETMYARVRKAALTSVAVADTETGSEGLSKARLEQLTGQDMTETSTGGQNDGESASSEAES